MADHLSFELRASMRGDRGCPGRAGLLALGGMAHDNTALSVEMKTALSSQR